MKRRHVIGALLAALAGATAPGCTGTSGAATDAQASEDGRIYSAATRPAEKEVRVLVLHDMEGLSGQSDSRTFTYADREHYPEGRALLIGDVNAVIAGLFDGGATSVDVVDGHGSGNPEPDIPAAELDPRATQILRDAPFRQYVDLVAPRAYDAVAVVGMHAKTGSRGFASHTYTLGIEFRMNGQPITETELVAYSFGREGIPVIFASGDDRLEADLSTMPWIEYVRVKNATSASTAEPLPLEEARAALRAGAQRAVERLAEMKVVTLETPIETALRAVPPASLSVLRDVPGIDYADETVTFSAPDFAAAYDGLIALVTVARTGYASVLQEALREHPAGAEIREQNRVKLFERWLDVESGRWSAPEPRAAEERMYHGAN